MALKFKNNKDLLKKISQGDQESFKIFYNLEFEKIYRFVSFKINNDSEAEEIVQDIFFKFWDYVRDGNNVNNALALLYKMARNRVVDYYRKHGVRPKILSLDGEQDFQIASDKISDQDIENELDIGFEIQSIEQTIIELPDDYQDVLVMRFIREMEVKEIAEALDKSQGAVRIMIFRALKTLKKLLNKKND
ncbi:hypothetical protein A3B87_03140 [Candidatus Kuenenbacteria bacterium RIFCSPHIGHO2_02_FULL_39_13]|uniref:RNA polymerase sigma factor 70 region 4 type 2 domain-containing protein n=1 Tax=Candidatus Kuenenbacteria bacterium RIFCSPHIGHO2_02_FULL_39_13 TaxID=1798561 RepID=A0A1F6FMU8_9BACT|nr:MAG: hypothetical protein A3B87_03140 [Candidatus Kuenenbacteria bacterium RIFCSPHIGHO2_02_FULL_39_13]